jgi:hypothetical protein
MLARARKTSFPGLLLLFDCLPLLLICNLTAALPSKLAKKILGLYSYQGALPGNLESDGVISADLKSTSNEILEFCTKFLDLAQFPDLSHRQNLLSFLRGEYAGPKIDLSQILPTGWKRAGGRGGKICLWL